MSEIDTSTKATLQRYWNPHGGGVEPHDAGLLYLRDDVDAVIAALRAKNERLRATPPEVRALVAASTALRDQIARWHAGGPVAGPEESRALFEALNEALTDWEAAQK